MFARTLPAMKHGVFLYDFDRNLQSGKQKKTEFQFAEKEKGECLWPFRVIPVCFYDKVITVCGSSQNIKRLGPRFFGNIETVAEYVQKDGHKLWSGK